MEAATKPYYASIPMVQRCRAAQEVQTLQIEEKEPNPYQTILARELFQRLDTAKMVIICHTNSHTSEQIFKTQVELHQSGIYLKKYGKAVLQEAINGTRFEAIQCLFEAPSSIIYSTENQVAKTLKILKKLRVFIVLAGIVDDRFLNRNELIEYSKLPSLDVMRARFAAELNSSGSSILNKLEMQQSNLCQMLDTHAKILGDTVNRTSSAETESNESDAGKNDAVATESTSPPPSTEQ